MTRLQILLGSLCLLVACGGNEASGTGGGGTTSAGGSGGSGGVVETGGSGGMAPDPCEELGAAFDAALATASDAEALPGGTVAAVETTSCGVWMGAAGEADDGVPMAATSLLRVGSVTKTYVAAAIVTLADQDELSLDDTLTTFVTTASRTRTKSPCGSC